MLDQEAERCACYFASPTQLEDLQDCLAQANLADPVVANPDVTENTDELENRLHIDQSFHRLLAESSGNPQLVDLLEQIFSKMALLRLTTTYQNPDVLEIWAEHEQIVEAILQRDSQAAAIAVRDHLVASKARVVQALQDIKTGLRTESSLQGIALF